MSDDLRKQDVSILYDPRMNGVAMEVAGEMNAAGVKTFCVDDWKAQNAGDDSFKASIDVIKSRHCKVYVFFMSEDWQRDKQSKSQEVAEIAYNEYTSKKNTSDECKRIIPVIFDNFEFRKTSSDYEQLKYNKFDDGYDENRKKTYWKSKFENLTPIKSSDLHWKQTLKNNILNMFPDKKKQLNSTSPQSQVKNKSIS